MLKMFEECKWLGVGLWYSAHRIWTIVKPTRVRWMRLHGDAKQPIRAYETDAGWDIYGSEDLDLPPNSHTNISTGIAIEVQPGWSYDVRGRSGLNRVGVIAALGLCDARYTGEIRVVLSNLSGEHYAIKKGERVGQVKLNPVWDMPHQEVKKFNPKPGTRGANGWGSSGR